MKFNPDKFWHRAAMLAVIDLVLVVLLLLFGAGGRADYSVLYGTLVSCGLAVLLEAYFADKNFRKFSPAELVGAGLLGAIATSMAISLILYAFGIII